MKNKKDILNQLDSILWKLFDILRGSLPVEDIEIIFLFISAYKDGVLDFNVLIESESKKDYIFNELNSSEKYREIFIVYHPIFQNINSQEIETLFSYLDRIYYNELEVLDANFGEIFDNLLVRHTYYLGKKADNNIQPVEITKLIMNLANLQEEGIVFNPFAGLASYSIFLNEDQSYNGQEYNARTWALGKLRIMAHDNLFNEVYAQENSLKNWPEDVLFDLIVSTPPFKLPVPRYLNSTLTGEPYGTVESFLIDKGIHSLSNNGQLIVVLPLSFLFSTGRQGSFKENLIKNHLIDTIVLLPSGLFSNTNIPVCIVVFKVISHRTGFVRFVDGSTFFTEEGPRKKTLNYIALNELIRKDVENEFLRFVSDSEIHRNDFDLSVGRYFLKEIQGQKLSNFTSIIRGSIIPQNSEMKIVQIRNLKEDVFNGVLKSNEIEVSLVKRPGFRLIQESCILLATRWNTLKPTYFEYTGEPIVISEAIVALRLNENIVDPTFLIIEFSADYVKEQLDAYRIGSIQPMLRKNDLQNILFQLPSLSEQRAKVSGINELSSRLKKIETDKENLLSGFKKEETESSTSLSHILGKPLLSIGSSIEIIQNSLSKLDPNWKEIMISEHRQFKMSDAFESIVKNVKYIQELADENTSLVSVSKFELTEVNFLKFLSQYVKNEKKSLNHNIELVLDVHDDVREQMDNHIIIKGNEQKLRIVFNNLIDNAKNHAFIDNYKEYKINIEVLPYTGNELKASKLEYDIDGRKSYVEIKVSNTGKPFPKDFTLNDYVRKNFAAGKTRNKGLGGYEVNEILKVHNEGKKALNLISSLENQEYSSTISFIIPVI